MNKLHSLQALRAIAAWLVVFAHALLTLYGEERTSASMRALADFLGMLGVSVFFVISGFIMIHTSTNEYGSRGAAWRFFRKRLLRVAPMYWLITFVVIGLALVGRFERMTTEQVVKSLLFIPYSIEPGKFRPVLGQGWTLNYEMFFYALFAISLLLRREIAQPILFTVLVGLVAVGRLVSALGIGPGPNSPLTFWCDPILLLFAAGMALGLIRRRMAERPIPLFRWPVLGATLALAGLVAVYFFFDGSLPLAVGWQVTLWMVSVLVVAGGVLTRQEAEGRATRFLEQVGNASYSIYLVHTLVLLVVAKGWSLLFHGNYAPGLFLTMVVAATAGGLLVYTLVEAPLTLRLRDVLEEKGSKTYPRLRLTEAVTGVPEEGKRI